MNKIRELREDRDLKQSDVATATGIDQRTLSNYETGKTKPDSFAILKLADFFDVSTDYLLGRTDLASSSISDILSRIDIIRKELDNIEKDIKKIGR